MITLLHFFFFFKVLSILPMSLFSYVLYFQSLVLTSFYVMCYLLSGFSFSPAAINLFPSDLPLEVSILSSCL